MKVLYILDYGTIGGATHSFLEMVVAMKERGVHPVVCLSRETDITTLLDEKGIEYFYAGHRSVLVPFFFKGFLWPYSLFRIAFSYYYRELLSLRRLYKLDLSSIDIIHTNSARNDIGCYLNKKYGIPHIMHIREFGDMDFDCITFRPNFVSLYNRFTTQFVCISDAVKQHWIKKGICESKVTTVYNGIHYEDILESSDEDKIKETLKILIAGGVIPAKGQHIAVQAFGYIPVEIRNKLTLDIAGWADDDYIQMMKDYADERGYGTQIRFIGPVKHLHECIGNYQIGLMCSRAEGFGRVTAEYMHGRLGVIASDSGANPELIENGVTGLLFKSGDPKSLADCVIRLYTDREQLIRLSKAAQNKAKMLYTQQKNADTIYHLYEQLLIKNN